MKNIFLLTGMSLVLLASGCASIVTGTDQTLTFNSEPSGATVTVAGQVLGQTPLSVPISKGKNKSITFEKEGYKTHSSQLATSTNPWVLGNVVFGGFVGSTTDGLTGAINEFQPDHFFVTLAPENSFGVTASKPRKVKELVVAFGNEIRKDLAEGGGEAADAVIDILGLSYAERVMSQKVLSQLAKQHGNDLDFANAIIDVYSLQ